MEEHIEKDTHLEMMYTRSGNIYGEDIHIYGGDHHRGDYTEVTTKRGLYGGDHHRGDYTEVTTIEGTIRR